MNILNGNATLSTPEVLMRFLLYKDSTYQYTTQFAPDAWVDFDTIFGPQFQAGTQHQITLLTDNRKPATYQVVVAKAPLLQQVPHPDQHGQQVALAMLYLAPAQS